MQAPDTVKVKKNEDTAIKLNASKVALPSVILPSVPARTYGSSRQTLKRETTPGLPKSLIPSMISGKEEKIKKLNDMMMVEMDMGQGKKALVTVKNARKVLFKGLELTSAGLRLASEIEDPYGIAAVAGVVATFIDLVCLARANSKQLTSLSNRVERVIPILEKILGAPKAKADIQRTLKRFIEVIKACTKEAEKYSGKKWTTQMMKVVKAGANEGKFKELNEQLTEALSDLGTCLNISMAGMLEQAKNLLELQSQQAALDKQELLDAVLKTKEQELQKKQESSKLSAEEKKRLIGQQLQSVVVEVAEDLKLTGAEKQRFLEEKIGKLHRTYSSAQLQLDVKKPDIDPQLLIPLHEIEFKSEVAKASFGAIYLGQWCEMPVAVKKIGKQLTEKQYHQFAREVQIMASLRNPFIVQLYGATLEPEAALIMEYMENSSLDKYLQKEALSNEAKKSIGLGIAKGLLYLHNRNILHRDLKTGNVVVNAQGQAKLTDFGLSKTQDQNVATAMEQTTDIQWVAPEILFSTEKKPRFTAESDIYSFGMVLWSLCTGKPPFDKLSEGAIIKKLKAGEREVLDKDIPEVFQRIILGCWQENPEDRPSLADIIRELNVFALDLDLGAEPTCDKGVQYAQQKDYFSAERCYRLAAEKGFFRAQTNLGELYLHGLGVDIDKEQAFDWMLKAAQQCHGRAQFNVAVMFELGDGVDKDTQAAIAWYQEAAKQNVPKAAEKAKALQSRYPAQPATAVNAPRK